MKFAHRYKLLRDIPGYNAGRTVVWDGNQQKFFFVAISEWAHDKGAEGIYADRDGPKFTVSQVSDAAWFEPLSKLADFIPAFPSQKQIADFVDLMPSCRLVNDVDECRAINELLHSKKFQARLYKFYKEQYESFHKLNNLERKANVKTIE